MDCIAHRGFAGVNPENTVRAIRDVAARAADGVGGGGVESGRVESGRVERGGVESGSVEGGSIDGVEVDVRRCGSGDLVVHHDETVDRTTSGSGRVADHTAAELAGLSVDGFDAGVPTLAAVVDEVPPDLTLHAELKERGLGSDLEAVLADARCPVVVSSFDATALDGIDGYRRALLGFEAGDVIERAGELDCWGVGLQQDAVIRSVTDRAHEAGLVVNAWTITSPVETRELRELDVDGVITDFPSCCPSRV